MPTGRLNGIGVKGLVKLGALIKSRKLFNVSSTERSEGRHESFFYNRHGFSCAYEVKTKLSLFERPFKMKKKGVCLLLYLLSF